MTVGAMPPGSVLQSPPPSGEPNIEAIPGSGGSLNPPSGGANGAQGANSRPSKSFYQTRIDGTRGGAQQARREVSASRERDPLADIPKLSTPTEAAPAAEASPPVAPTAGDRPAAENKPSPTGKPAETSAGLGPGIRRFKVIEPRLAIGNLPTETGWKWLSELGYRTVIDLRQPAEVQAGDLAAINHQGLRYLSIPMSATEIDPATIARLEKPSSSGPRAPAQSSCLMATACGPASVGFLHLVNVRKADALARAEPRKLRKWGRVDRYSPLEGDPRLLRRIGRPLPRNDAGTRTGQRRPSPRRRIPPRRRPRSPAPSAFGTRSSRRSGTATRPGSRRLCVRPWTSQPRTRPIRRTPRPNKHPLFPRRVAKPELRSRMERMIRRPPSRTP